MYPFGEKVMIPFYPNQRLSDAMHILRRLQDLNDEVMLSAV